MKKAISALLSLLLGGLLVLPVAACGGPSDRNSNLSDSTAEGIDKNDPYTWFDPAKDVLPTREQCEEIVPDMRLNEVIKKLGKPQRDIGYGAVLYQFDVADGSVFTVRFRKDASGTLSDYDSLVVEEGGFGTAIPDRYFPQQIALSELYPWMGDIDEGDIVRIRREKAFIGVAPYDHWRDIAYSTDKADIACACRLFDAPLHAISQDEGQIDGGGYVEYDFVTAEETYSVTISNRTVLIGGQYYRFDGELPELAAPDTECHAFITYATDDPYEIYTYAKESEKIGDFYGLGKFEFRVYDGLQENAPRFVLKSAGGVNLLILSPDLFLIEGDDNTVVYQITGSDDFSDLFAENI